MRTSPASITLALVVDTAAITTALIGASGLAARINDETGDGSGLEALSRAVNLIIGDGSSDARVLLRMRSKWRRRRKEVQSCTCQTEQRGW